MESRFKSVRLLAVAYDYRPRMGGLATLSFELLRALSAYPDIKIRLLTPQAAGAEGFDVQSPIETVRVSVPQSVTGVAFTFARFISKEIRQWKPDCILLFLWIPDGLGSFLAWPSRKIKRVPYFVFANGVELLESAHTWRRRLRWALQPIKRAVFQGAASVFAISHFSQEVVEKKCGVKKEKISIIYPGVDADLFSPGPKAEDLIREHGLQDKKVFLTLTRLDDYKGIDQAILAMKEVVQRHPEAHYLICGEGRDQARLEGLIRDLGLSAHVTLVSALPFNRVRDYYNLADVFVLLSRQHRDPPDVEGFGIVFLEAAACEKPVIGGNSGGIPDAVADGFSGWLVPPTDTALIAKTMIEALENPAKALEFGKNGRARVLSQFTWRHMAEQTRQQILLYLTPSKMK